MEHTKLPKSVLGKILRAMAQIGAVEKDGVNQHFKFKYQQWSDVLPAVRRACIDVGLLVIPSMSLIDAHTQGNKTMIDLTVTLADPETGDSFAVSWVGEANDSQDKGVQKAGTSGEKYLLLKLFMIPEEDEDPDGSAVPATSSKQPQAVPAGESQVSAKDELSAAMKSTGVTSEICNAKLRHIMSENKRLSEKKAREKVVQWVIEMAKNGQHVDDAPVSQEEAVAILNSNS